MMWTHNQGDEAMTRENRRMTDPRGRRAMVVGALVVVIAIAAIAGTIGFASITNHSTSEDNCTRIHTLTVTLDDIVASGKDQLEAYEREGTITAAQLARALEDNDRAREKLAGADCPARTRKATP